MPRPLTTLTLRARGPGRHETEANLAVPAPAWLFGTTGVGAAIQLRAAQNAVYDVSVTYYSE